MKAQQKKRIHINTVEATFLFRALLSFKGKINEVLQNDTPLTPALEDSMEYMKEVAIHQDNITSDLMDMLTENFATDTKYLLPQ